MSARICAHTETVPWPPSRAIWRGGVLATHPNAEPTPSAVARLQFGLRPPSRCTGLRHANLCLRPSLHQPARTPVQATFRNTPAADPSATPVSAAPLPSSLAHSDAPEEPSCSKGLLQMQPLLDGMFGAGLRTRRRPRLQIADELVAPPPFLVLSTT